MWERKIFVTLIIDISQWKSKTSFDQREYNCCTSWQTQYACTEGHSGTQVLGRQE